MKTNREKQETRDSFPCPAHPRVTPIKPDRPSDCNLRSLPKRPTDVHAGFASLGLVQDQRRRAFIQPSTALIYPNQNQPDAVGLI